MQDLLNLTPVALKSLRSIGVTIGTSPCDGSHSLLVYKARGGCHGTVAEIMESDAQLAANGVLEAWRSFCSMLAANKTRDDQFELRLICSAALTETAAAFLTPIHDLPRLKALSIRMGPNRNLDIQNMVMKTIRQKTTYFCPEPERSFPFLKLPVELRIRVLEHTGLIASRHFISRIVDKCFTSLECRLFKCAGYPIGFRNSGDNYCPSTPTDFSTAYPCEDFIPDALFLVRKTVRLLALSVFYSRNTFEVCYQERGLLPHVPPPVEAPWSPQTSRFIRQFPAHSWQHLRHVRWIFCCLRINRWRKNYFYR